MWGTLPQGSEISVRTCLAVLDPVPWSSAMLRGQGSAPTGGSSPVSIHTAGARTQEEVLVVLNALFEQLKGEMFPPTTPGLLEKQSSVATNTAMIPTQ